VASIVLVLTAAARLAGPALLRQHPNGATLALLGMGIPVNFSAASARVAGMVTLSDYPALLIATFAVVATTMLTGFVAARRRPAATMPRLVLPAAAWFAAFSTLTAVGVSHARPIVIAGVAVDLNVSALLTLAVSAIWAAVGMTAGVLVARSLNHRAARAARSSWIRRGPGAAVVAGAVMVMGVAACGGGPQTGAVALGQPKTHDAATTTTTVETTTTTVAASSAPTASTGRSASRSTRSSSAGAATGGSTAAAAAASAPAGFAPATPGTYRYNTSGSTSSLLGKQSAPSVSTLVVDAPQGTKQHSVRQILSANGDGFVIDQILDYQPQGVAVVRQRLAMTQKGSTTVRTLNAAPTTVVIPMGTATGTHREFDLSGVSIAGHEAVDLVESVVSNVGGQALNTVLVRTVLHVSGSVSGTIQLDQWWAAAARVPAREQLTATMKSGFATVKTNYSATLQSVTPS